MPIARATPAFELSPTEVLTLGQIQRRGLVECGCGAVMPADETYKCLHCDTRWHIHKGKLCDGFDGIEDAMVGLADACCDNSTCAKHLLVTLSNSRAAKEGELRRAKDYAEARNSNARRAMRECVEIIDALKSDSLLPKDQERLMIALVRIQQIIKR